MSDYVVKRRTQVVDEYFAHEGLLPDLSLRSP